MALVDKNGQHLIWARRIYLPRYCNFLVCPSAVHVATKKGSGAGMRVKLGSDYIEEPVPVLYGTKDR